MAIARLQVRSGAILVTASVARYGDLHIGGMIGEDQLVWDVEFEQQDTLCGPVPSGVAPTCGTGLWRMRVILDFVSGSWITTQQSLGYHGHDGLPPLVRQAVRSG